MKILKYKIIGVIIIGILCKKELFAQINPNELKGIISNTNFKNLYYSTQIKEYYMYMNYQPTWISNDNIASKKKLLELFYTAKILGLNMEDYPIEFMIRLQNSNLVLTNLKDSINAEIKLTNDLIKFTYKVLFGNEKPDFKYDGLKEPINNISISKLLADLIRKNQLDIKNIKKEIYQMPEINIIELWINKLLDIQNETLNKEVIIKDKSASKENSNLIYKLYQLNLIENQNIILSDSIIKEKVKLAQRMFNLIIDGIINNRLIKELNIPISTRIKQLIISVNYYRWLTGLQLKDNQTLVNINIPSAYMKVYKDNNIILSMRMIVGKKVTPTPTLTSKIKEVILYPYWHVPYSIATKELLPAIKRNTEYLEKGNYQVLNNNGRIIDPNTVNWHELSTSYFPYTIRQSTGCDNSLGLIKLNFLNPYGVYLHDTPNKSLFEKERRFLSHGCMRMEKPIELGHLLLKNNTIAIDTLEQKGCLKNKEPVIVHADNEMPIIVWYNPAGIDNKGELVFFEDIYKQFK